MDSIGWVKFLLALGLLGRDLTRHNTVEANTLPLHVRNSCHNLQALQELAKPILLDTIDFHRQYQTKIGRYTPLPSPKQSQESQQAPSELMEAPAFEGTPGPVVASTSEGATEADGDPAPLATTSRSAPAGTQHVKGRWEGRVKENGAGVEVKSTAASPSSHEDPGLVHATETQVGAQTDETSVKSKAVVASGSGGVAKRKANAAEAPPRREPSKRTRVPARFKYPKEISL
jgi:hypothetical protein